MSAAPPGLELPGAVQQAEGSVVRPPEGARPPRPVRRTNLRLPALAATGARAAATEDVENPRPVTVNAEDDPAADSSGHAQPTLDQLVREGFEKMKKMPRRIKLVNLQPKTYHASLTLEPEPEPDRAPEPEREPDPQLKRVMDELAAAQKKAADLAHVQETLDSLEIKTLSGKVRTIERSTLGSSWGPLQTKLLYLTAKQASEFDFEESFSTLLSELNIPTPGLVINVMPAKGGLSMDNVQFLDSKLDLKRYSELNKEALLASTRTCRTFVTECVLPVAIDNNALILINDSECALSREFAQVLGEYSSTSSDPPFTILHIGCTEKNADACRDPGCHAYKLRSTQPNWVESQAEAEKSKKQDRFGELASKASKKGGDTQKAMRQFVGGPDMIPFCNAYIVIEGVDAKGNPCFDIFANFYSKFVQQEVERGWPNITFGSYDLEISAVADAYVNRGLRFMFLDTRVPPGQAHASPSHGQALASPDVPRSADGYATSFEDAQRDLENFEYELIRRGSTNWYDTCTMGHLHAVYENVAHKLEAERNSIVDDLEAMESGGNSGSGGGNGGKSQGQCRFIGELILYHERVAANREHKRGQTAGVRSDLAADPANEATEVLERLSVLRRKVYNQWALLLLTEIWMPTLDAIREGDLAGLNAWLTERSLDCRLYVPSMEGNGVYTTPLINWTPAVMKSHGPETKEPYFVEMLGHADSPLGLPGTRSLSVVVLCLNTDVVQPALLPTVIDCMRQLLETMRTDLERGLKAKLTSSEVHSDTQPKLRKLLTDPKVYHGNINDVQTLKERIQQIATSSRLPHCNSEPAIRVLAQAWDAVDIYSAEANRSKTVAKVAYIVLLIIAMATTVTTVLSLNSPQKVEIDGADFCPDGGGNYTSCGEGQWWHFDDAVRGAIVVALSLAASLLGSITAYIDPQQRWTVLRGAALELTGEIWKFRTRTGNYAMANGSSKDAERYLQQYLNSIKEHVQKSASVNESGFYGKFEIFGGAAQSQQQANGDALVLSRAPRSPGIYTHGQYANKNGKYEGRAIRGTFGDSNPYGLGPGLFDDHQSPCTCEQYLKLRVEPQVAFYQRRLPGYYRKRTLFESLLLIGALSGTLLAFLNLDEWTAAVTAVSSAVTAWMAFHNTARKINRYSNCIDKVGAQVLAWRSLTSVEQARVDRQNDLVTECEDLFERERDAWLSTSAHQKPTPETEDEGAEQGEGAGAASA